MLQNQTNTTFVTFYHSEIDLGISNYIASLCKKISHNLPYM